MDLLRISAELTINLDRLASIREKTDEAAGGARLVTLKIGDDTIPLTAEQSAAFLDYLARSHTIREMSVGPVTVSGGTEVKDPPRPGHVVFPGKPDG